jgi:hypothetical protein
MKHIYLLFCVLFVSALQSQNLTFLDANFKAKLVAANVNNLIAFDSSEHAINIDTNTDGEIQVTEAELVYGLDISHSFITNLSGISNFPNLKVLDCSYNGLTSLIIDNTINIWILNASHNSLNSFSANFADSVEGMDLSYNNLTSFAVTGSVFWDDFNLSHNQLSTLSLTDVTFDYFNVSYNNLSAIQYSQDVWFTRSGNFSNNQFAVLDFSAASFTYDATLILGYNNDDTLLFNELSKPGNIFYSSDNTTFDMGNFHATTDCDPEDTGHVVISNSPNLQHIIFKNGIDHGYHTCNEGGTIFQNPSLSLQISNCPNLNHICGDPLELSVLQSIINLMGLQSQVVVDSNCTSSFMGTDAFSPEKPFAIAPVPTHDVIQISTRNNQTIEVLEIYNHLGQVVQREMGSNPNVDVSALVKGSYLLKIITAETSYVRHFLKQ